MWLTDNCLRSGVTREPVRPARGLHVLRRALDLHRRDYEGFPFFADAGNLERLTPGFLRFELLSSMPIEMRAGATIDYRLRIHGIPIVWQSRITVWEPPHRFIDVQVVGPYRWWHHEHRFESTPQGTRVLDAVEYAVPGGAMIERLLVRPDLERIFAFRHQQLLEIFSTPERSDIRALNPLEGSPRRQG